MATVSDVLKASGFTDNEIERLDSRATTAFNRVLTEAQQAREAAETAQRSNIQFYEDRIVPALTGWESERNQIVAERDAAQQQRRYFQAAAQAAGIPLGSPETGNGYVTNDPNQTPGSPSFTMSDIDNRLGQGLGNALWAIQRYQRLYGNALPDDVETLAAEASKAGSNFRDFVSRRYNFDAKERELQQQRQQEHDDAIRKETEREVTRRLTEQSGSNPDVRRGVSSNLAEISRAVKTNQRPDPLLMDGAGRRGATRAAIRQEISEHLE
jgi:hypothetical protein